MLSRAFSPPTRQQRPPWWPASAEGSDRGRSVSPLAVVRCFAMLVAGDAARPVVPNEVSEGAPAGQTLPRSDFRSWYRRNTVVGQVDEPVRVSVAWSLTTNEDIGAARRRTSSGDVSRTCWGLAWNNIFHHRLVDQVKFTQTRFYRHNVTGTKGGGVQTGHDGLRSAAK